jgi:hypothetical protein
VYDDGVPLKHRLFSSISGTLVSIMLLPMSFVCPHCCQSNESAVDPSQGELQSYVEDCQVCCRPLVLRVRLVEGEAEVEASPESE